MTDLPEVTKRNADFVKELTKLMTWARNHYVEWAEGKTGPDRVLRDRFLRCWQDHGVPLVDGNRSATVTIGAFVKAMEEKRKEVASGKA